jgi:hypothetical protein
MAAHRKTDAATTGRIYVSSRTSCQKNGMLANEEESIYEFFNGIGRIR